MKTKFPTAVSLNRQQIEWLKQQPNASELIGKLIDALMIVDKLAPEAFASIQTHTALEHLKQKISDVQMKRFELIRGNQLHFKQIKWSDGIHTDMFLENPHDPTPIDETGRIIKRQLLDYDESMKQMAQEVERLTKNQVASLEQKPQSTIPTPESYCSVHLEYSI